MKYPIIGLGLLEQLGWDQRGMEQFSYKCKDFISKPALSGEGKEKGAIYTYQNIYEYRYLGVPLSLI